MLISELKGNARAMIVFYGIVVGALSVLNGGVAAQEKVAPLKFNYVGGLSVQAQSRDIEVPFWTKRVPEASGGAVQVNIKAWNELGLKGPEILNLIRQGVYQGGWVPLGYNSSSIFINDAMDLAGQSEDIDTLRDIVTSFRPILESYYEKNLGLKLLSVAPYPPQVTLCRAKIDGLADLKGRRVRTSTASQAAFVRALGGNDVTMASTEVQAALVSGAIDCGVTSALSAYKQSWHESAKFLLPLPINWQLIAVDFNLAFWNGLPPETQNFLTEQINWLDEQVWAQSLKEEKIGIACLTGSAPCSEGDAGDMSLVEIEDSDRALLSQTFADKILPGWAEQCGSDCATQWNETIGKIVGHQVNR